MRIKGTHDRLVTEVGGAPEYLCPRDQRKRECQEGGQYHMP